MAQILAAPTRTTSPRRPRGATPFGSAASQTDRDQMQSAHAAVAVPRPAGEIEHDQASVNDGEKPIEHEPHANPPPRQAGTTSSDDDLRLGDSTVAEFTRQECGFSWCSPPARWAMLEIDEVMFSAGTQRLGEMEIAGSPLRDPSRQGGLAHVGVARWNRSPPTRSPYGRFPADCGNAPLNKSWRVSGCRVTPACRWRDSAITFC